MSTPGDGWISITFTRRRCQPGQLLIYGPCQLTKVDYKNSCSQRYGPSRRLSCRQLGKLQLYGPCQLTKVGHNDNCSQHSPVRHDLRTRAHSDYLRRSTNTTSDFDTDTWVRTPLGASTSQLHWANGLAERRMTEVMKHLRALVFELRIKENWSHSSIVSANYQLFSGWVNRNLTGSIDHYGYRELWLVYGLAKKVGGSKFYRQSGEAARGPSKINQGYARLSIKISAKTNHRLWRTGE